MFLIGLTGGIGSGKSTAAQHFRDLGIDVVDVDAVSRSVTAAGGAAIEAIREAFGEKAIDASGAMNRAYIRELVFENPAERKRLESILHPIIQRESLKALESANSSYCIVDVPLLFESGFWKNKVDRILVIDVPQEVQIERVKQRSGLTDERILSIIRAQTPRGERIHQADDIIGNTLGKEDLQRAVELIHQKYLSMADAR